MHDVFKAHCLRGAEGEERGTKRKIALRPSVPEGLAIQRHSAQQVTRLDRKSVYTSDSPSTYSRCQEQVAGKWPVIAGGLSSGGLLIHFSHNDVNENYGVAAVRKF